ERVRGPGIAIGTAVLAPAVGIDARLEPHVRALVLGDDRARPVGQVLRPRPTQRVEVLLVLLHLLELQLVMGGFEAIRGVEPRPAALRRRGIGSTHGSRAPIPPRTHFAEGPPRHTIHPNKTGGQSPPPRRAPS